MTSVTCELEHPILFVFEFANSEVQIPQYDEENVVSANESAISIRTIQAIDGSVTIHLGQSFPAVVKRGIKPVFRGLVSTPGCRINVVTAQNEQLLDMEVSGAVTGVLVTVDNDQHPTEIWIQAFDASK
jgi:hypothetical protein